MLEEVIQQGKDASLSDIKDSIRGTLVINDQSEIPLNELDQRGQYQLQTEQPIDGGDTSLHLLYDAGNGI